MPSLEVLRNIGLWIIGSYFLIQYGPPIVDRHFLPTIGYVADTFLAIAPLPPPSTVFLSTQPSMAGPPTPVVLKTIFVDQAVYGRESSPNRATITAMNYGKGSRSYNDDSHWGGSLLHIVSTILDWWTQLAYEVPRGLRQLLDNWVLQLSFLLAPAVTWQITKIRSQMILERITAEQAAEHKTEIARANKKSSRTAEAQDLLITELQGRIKAQDTRLNKAQADISAKSQAEDQSKSEIASLDSKLTSKDNEIARLRDSLDKANSRADTAESSIKTIEKKVKTARSDHDSALQKKENEVNIQEIAREKAAEERDAARSELKAARADAARDKKRITELQKQVTDSTTNATESQALLDQKNAIISQKDGTIRKMKEDATRASKEAQKAKATDRENLRELQGRLTTANKLREDAEAKASRNEQESKTKDGKIEDFKTSCSYRERRIASLEAAHDKLRLAYENEQAEARDAGTKAQKIEEALLKRVAELEEQIQGMSASSTVAAPNSDVSPPSERSTSSQPNPVVPFSGPRRPRYVAPANGETFSDPEAKGLPAETPRGPKGLPAETPRGPKAGRGGSRGGRGSGRGTS